MSNFRIHICDVKFAAFNYSKTR